MTVNARRPLADEQATAALGAEIALFLKRGDVVALHGDLGAGKTTLARGLIRALAYPHPSSSTLDVPSPSFSLVQHYDTTQMPVLHADLYRLGDGASLDELGLDEGIIEGVVLVEWPQRSDLTWLGPDRLDVYLETQPGHHSATLTGSGSWAMRLERMVETAEFLESSEHRDWTRRSLSADASARRYELLLRENDAVSRQRLLMDSPAMPDPGVGAVPYSRIVHLAEDIVPFLAIADTLRGAGFATPEIFAADPDAGFAVLGHLGQGSVLEDGAPVADRYVASMACVAAIQDAALPGTARWDDKTHVLPALDRGVLHAEAELVLDWYIPHVTGQAACHQARATLTEALDDLVTIEGILAPPHSWVLRDHHSPNIIWRPQHRGFERVGLIDFQDALKGPAAYDAASLAYDARVDVPPALTDQLIETFLSEGQARIAGFDPSFERLRVASFAAQRNLKILGIFARLAKRDGKPGYLRHLPRIRAYLSAALDHPALSGLGAWCHSHLDLTSPTS
jgi:tRNA threonylcarbamoyl adenosine modification protein YjeE